MGKTLDKEKIIKILFNAFQVALAACFAYMIITAIKDNYIACLEKYPREYRESANLSLARGFIDGINIYTIPNGTAIPVYVYGFVNPLIASVITKISGISLLNSFYFIYFATTFVFSALLTYEVYDIVKGKVPGFSISVKNLDDVKYGNLLLIMSVFIVSYTLTFRIGHITSIPDTLGMVVGITIMMITRRSKSARSVFIISLLVVLEFYIKAYFLFFAAPVFFYFLIRDRKKMLEYMLFCVLIGISSIIIVNSIFPLYFIENIYFEFIEQFLNAYADESVLADKSYEFNYMMNQFIKLIEKYNFILIIAVVLTIVAVFRFVKEKGKESDKDLLTYEISILIAIPLLVVLGKNDGAYMSYHLQLLMPGVIPVAYSRLVTIYNNGIDNERFNRTIVKTAILFVALVTTYKSYVAYGKVSLMTDEEKSNWQYVENICLDAYDSGKLIFPGTLVNGVLINNRSFYSDFNGHTYLNYADEQDAIMASENGFMNLVFSELDEMYVYAAEYNKQTDDNFKNSKYDLIIADEENVLNRVNAKNYNSEKVILKMGQFDCEVVIYTKKEEQ